MVYEVRETGSAFRIVCVVASGVVRVVAVKHDRDEAERMAGDLERFNALFEATRA